MPTLPEFYSLRKDGTVEGHNSMLRYSEELARGQWYRCTRCGQSDVSTTFLFIDHGFGFGSRPVCFETLVFPGLSHQRRYYTRDAAIRGHIETVRKLGGYQQYRSSRGARW